MNILTGKNQISQEAMETIATMKANKKELEKQIKELEEELINALHSGRKPAKGRLYCQIKTTERRTPRYKEELEKRITKAELQQIIENTIPSISESIEIKISPTF